MAALVLSDHQRTTLIRTADHYGDEAYRLMIEKRDDLKEHGGDYPPDVRSNIEARIAWLGDQAAGWFEIAQAIRVKQGIR